MQVRALIIRDDKNKFKDLEDVVKVARALGQQVFKTNENVYVKRVWHDAEYGYIVLVEETGCCSRDLGVRSGKNVKK